MTTTQQQFYQMITEHSRRSGFELPFALAEYLAQMLDIRLTRVDIIPEPSFAESYLQLYQCSEPSAYIDFADTTLFFCSLLPEYGHRRGLSMDYYASLGISTYYTAGDLFADPRFTQLGNWFYHLQKFLYTMFDPERRLSILDMVSGCR